MFTRVTIVPLTIAALGALSISACSQSQFAGSANVRAARTYDAVPAVTSLPPMAPSEKSQSFTLSASKGAVDIVWLIDTSGSMREETELVRQNFTNFLGTLGSRTDVRLTLIASPMDIQLDPRLVSMGHAQIPIEVESNNALEIAAQQLQGPLRARLRPNAKLVIVVVTDDNAEVVDQTNFLQMAAQSGQRPTVFAFRGAVDRFPYCSVAARGVAYEALAQVTGGRVFDICDTNWSGNFAILVEAVATLASTQFRVSDPTATRITSVSVDGMPLPQNAYTVQGPGITLNPNAVSPTARALEIRYM